MHRNMLYADGTLQAENKSWSMTGLIHSGTLQYRIAGTSFYLSAQRGVFASGRNSGLLGFTEGVAYLQMREILRLRVRQRN